MTTRFTELVVEDAVLAWLGEIGWHTANGPDIAPDMPAAERADFDEVILRGRLREALTRVDPTLPTEALEEAFRKLTRTEGPELIHRNRSLHRLLVDGVTVEYRDSDGAIRGAQARVIDFDYSASNDRLAVNQFSVVENKHSRRPNIVLFVNDLPLAVLELKNAASENATIWSAYQQLQTYKAEIPSFFASNALLVISDGVEARVGTLTAGREWFKPWRTISGEALADAHLPELQVVTEGLLTPSRFLDLLRDFIVFEDDGSGRITKKMTGYHQFHAVQAAVHETLRAAELARLPQVAEQRATYEAGTRPGGRPGDRRVGVVWHTQGSGKSLTMAFYSGRIIREPAMENPTLVVLTDRADLDDQLFATFSLCSDLLRQPPVQAESRAHLRELLAVESGGVVFTTIHRFFPQERGDRQRIGSIAHRKRIGSIINGINGINALLPKVERYQRH
jgi:type I restriction enzyme R subunit